jgi:RAB protein geranylgeranyltransferase component A
MYKESFGNGSVDSLQRKFYSKANQDDPKALQDFDLRNYLKELIKQLSDKQPVSQEELMKLANDRTEAIKNHMLTVQLTKPERIVIMETENYEQEDRNWVKCKLGIGSL